LLLLEDVLLATKLHVLCPQPGFVPRLRLVEALDEGRQTRPDGAP
jgi:hypothetical protein